MTGICMFPFKDCLNEDIIAGYLVEKLQYELATLLGGFGSFTVRTNCLDPDK